MYVTPSTTSTLANPTFQGNLSIDVANPFNFKHPYKSNLLRLLNLSIDVGNSFNSEHHDKSNLSRVVNLSIDVGNSFNFEHRDKSKY